MRTLLFLVIFFILYSYQPDFICAFNCLIPNGCRIDYVRNINKEIIGKNENPPLESIVCDIDSEFIFTYKDPPQINNNSPYCQLGNNETEYFIILFQFKHSSRQLDKRFNLTNAFRYFTYFQQSPLIRFDHLNGFDLDLFDHDDDRIFDSSKALNFIDSINCINCRLNFYLSQKLVSSCQDIYSNVSSFFHINTKYPNSLYKNFLIIPNERTSVSICPLVFENASFYTLNLKNLADSFYKTNVFTFINGTFPDLNSTVSNLDLYNVLNINLDLKLLNPWVFKKVEQILISYGTLNAIDGRIFHNFENFFRLNIGPANFRKLAHKQGIEWIRQLNRDMNVSLDYFNRSFIEFREKVIHIRIDYEYEGITQDNVISKIFSDEDFCIYLEFPFNQLVIIYLLWDIDIMYFQLSPDVAEFYESEYKSCTYLWLVQNYKYYLNYFISQYNYSFETQHILNVINSKGFKSISMCRFEEKMRFCNRSTYKIKFFWDDSDYIILNNKLQIGLKISFYIFSFIGLFTNSIVIVTILAKNNNDLFKEYKQYDYLCLNSVFCVIISVIEILSWMTECFYPFEVFCPEIRKLVGIQFFKIIFKECLVTVFRFMCSFTYVAFGLNRISLIGKDHGKLITFMSQVGIKNYILVTLFVSVGLSWVKYFKYDVNYGEPEQNYPIPNDWKIDKSNKLPFNDAFFILNFISDLTNYFAFVLINVVIDICMVVQLRRVLNEKEKKSDKSMSQKQMEKRKADNEAVVNKAIKMVILNSAIGVFLKLPVTIVPLINLYANFIYKDNRQYFKDFSRFYTMIINTGFYGFILDLSDVLYTISLSIQMMIYKRFDKKFKAGYDNIIELISNKLSKKNK